MSDTFGTPSGTGSGSAASAATVHEAYSFACMNCGHGWEQSYEIAHQTDEHGHTSCVYYAGSQPVPSPLTRPSCANCGGHLVRIMRSGRVSEARWNGLASAKPPSAAGSGRRRPADAGSGPEAFALPDDAVPSPDGAAGNGNGDGQPQRRPHWLADLLAIFHRRPPGDADGGDAHGGDAHHQRAA